MIESDLCPVIWMGDSKKNLMAFPPEVIQKIGYKLQLMQSGAIPTDTKQFKGVGSGVYEIALKYDKEAYRCVQALQLGDAIYVLHAFHKKSKSGIATPTRDVELIKKRFKDAKELANNDKRKD